MDYLERERVQTHFPEESLTIQSDSEKADIRKIMSRYKATGIIDSLNEADLDFRDVTEVMDFQEAKSIMNEAEFQFMELPSKVREIFEHNVAVWLDTAQDEEKRDALVAAGFIDPPEGDVAPVSGGDPGGAGGEGDPKDGGGVPDGTSG